MARNPLQLHRSKKNNEVAPHILQDFSPSEQRPRFFLQKELLGLQECVYNFLYTNMDYIFYIFWMKLFPFIPFSDILFNFL